MKKKVLFPAFLAALALPLVLQAKPISLSAEFIGEYSASADYVAFAKEVNGQLADEGFVKGNLHLIIHGLQAPGAVTVSHRPQRAPDAQAFIHGRKVSGQKHIGEFHSFPENLLRRNGITMQEGDFLPRCAQGAGNVQQQAHHSNRDRMLLYRL